MNSRRVNRVSSLLKREVSMIIQTEIKNVELGFVTVSDIELSEDLKIAKIFVTVLGDEAARKKALDGLQKVKPYVKREISKRLKLRYTPEIYFKYDKSLDHAFHIADVLKKIKEEDAKKEKNG